MPDGTGNRYDVFVSYAHADNEKPLGSAAQYGWITTLAHNLNTAPGRSHKEFFVDYQLKPSDVFSNDLLTNVENSTLLLLLLSQNYVNSKWCGTELDHFIRTHANDPEKPTDVFVVELLPFDTFTNVPVNIQTLRKRRIHAQFWHQPADASAPLLAGDPSPQESGPESERRYWRALHELRNAIDSRLRTLQTERPLSSVAVSTTEVTPAAPQPDTKPTLGTILLADTTDDLVPQRSAIKAALEPEGVVVLPEGDYVGLSPEEFETDLTSGLTQCELFVQLLSPTVGRIGRGFPAPLPQIQFDRAISAKLPIMQWCERLPGPDDITDPGHAKLFNTAYLRATNRTAFEREILERLRAIKQTRERNRETARTESIPTSDRKLIFVDDIAGEQPLTNKLRTVLEVANYHIRQLPPGALLGNNGIDITQVLKPCHAGITIFADRTKRDTVYNRLIFFQNRIVESGLSVVPWGIYVTSGTEGCDLGYMSRNVTTINEQSLDDFVSRL